MVFISLIPVPRVQQGRIAAFFGNSPSQTVHIDGFCHMKKQLGLIEARWIMTISLVLS
jgi:hypothetical protein